MMTVWRFSGLPLILCALGACATATEPDLTALDSVATGSAGTGGETSNAGSTSASGAIGSSFGGNVSTGGGGSASMSGRSGSTSSSGGLQTSSGAAGNGATGGDTAQGGSANQSGSAGIAGTGANRGAAGSGEPQTGCTGLPTWQGNSSTFKITNGEEIQWQNVRYKATQDISYPNGECHPDAPATWCAGWFVSEGSC